MPTVPVNIRSAWSTAAPRPSPAPPSSCPTSALSEISITTNLTDFRPDWLEVADNYYQSYVAHSRRYYEQIDAAYLMGTGKYLGATFRAGLRWEKTATEASEADTRTPAEVRAAGYTLTAAGVANTIPGIDSSSSPNHASNAPANTTTSSPSASLKYNLIRNLDVHFGYSSTIRRPSYVNLAGVWIINETSKTVALPNPGLTPETSDNFAARLAYYFKPVGQLAATFTQRNVKKLFIGDSLTAEEFGYTGRRRTAGLPLQHHHQQRQPHQNPQHGDRV